MLMCVLWIIYHTNIHEILCSYAQFNVIETVTNFFFWYVIAGCKKMKVSLEGLKLMTFCTVGNCFYLLSYPDCYIFIPCFSWVFQNPVSLKSYTQIPLDGLLYGYSCLFIILEEHTGHCIEAGLGIKPGIHT